MAVIHAADPAVSLDQLVVTGTNIPTPANELVSSVSVLTADDLAATGLESNAADIIRKALPQFAGSSNIGSSNAITGVASTLGGSELALHNLNTLVLIDGRRVAPSGANARGGNSFVDLNQIPAAAIERIEVDPDGDSAIYGADAVGGVVNLILKSDYRGAEFGLRYAAADGDGHYTERSGHLVAGAGSGGVSVTVTGSWSKTDPLLEQDRPFSQGLYGTNATIAGAVGTPMSFPQYFLNPALNSPRETNPVGTAATAASITQLVANGTYQNLGTAAFTDIAGTFNVSPYQTLLESQDQRAATVAVSAKLRGDKLVAFADYMRSETRSTSQIAAGAVAPNFTVPAGAPYNPTATTLTQVAFRYLPDPRSIANESQLERLSFGFRGEIGPDWNWETAGDWNRNGVTQSVSNIYYAPNLERAVAGGYDAQGNAQVGGAYSRVVTGFSESGTFVIQPALDPFARAADVNPASLANLLGTYVAQTRSQLDSYDAKLTGRFFALPAGKITAVAGFDLREEALQGIPDANSRLTGPTAQRWAAAADFDPFSRGRRVAAAFTEIRLPIASPAWNLPGIHELDFTAAGREEDYSDFGNSHSPKLGLRWQPVDDQFTLHAVASSSFLAPSLYSLYGSVTQGFAPVAVIPSVFGIAGQAPLRTGSDPNLAAASAESRSVGFTVAPRAIKGLTVTGDYLSVDQTNLTGSVGAITILQSVDALGPNSPYAAKVALGNFPGLAGAIPIMAPRQLTGFLAAGNSPAGIFVVDTAANIAGQRLRVFDLHLGYDWSLSPEMGALRLGTTGSFFLRDRFQALPGQPYYEYAGHAASGGTGAQGTLPHYRFYSTAQWHRGPWQATLGNTIVAPVTDIGPGGSAFVGNPLISEQPVAGFIDWDASADRTFGAWEVAVGVNNLTDHSPPLAPQAFSDARVDLSTYPFLGRMYFVSATLKY